MYNTQGGGQTTASVGYHVRDEHWLCALWPVVVYIKYDGLGIVG